MVKAPCCSETSEGDQGKRKRNGILTARPSTAAPEIVERSMRN